MQSGTDATPTQSAVPPSRLIHAHTGLRGVAACCVVCAHVRATFGAGALFTRAYLLVDLFFLLSGFVMAYTYGDRFGVGRARAEARRFWEARFARIYPLHAVVLIAMAAGATAFAAVESRAGRKFPFVVPIDTAWFRQLALVGIWGPADQRLAWNFPSWSIAAEAHVYLLCPLLLVLLARGRAIAAPVFVLVAIGLYVWLDRTPDQLDQIGALALARAGAGFLTGLVLAGARPVVRRVPGAALTAVQLLAVITAAAVIVLDLTDVLVIAPLALLVAATADDRGLVAWLAGSRAGQFLGERSYAIYLLHIPILLALGQVVIRTGPSLDAPPGRLLFDAIAAILIVAAADLSYRYLEGPARERLRRAFALRRRPIGHSIPAP